MDPVSVFFLSLSLFFGVLCNATIIIVNGFTSRNRYLNLQRLTLLLAVSDLLKTLVLNPLYIHFNTGNEDGLMAVGLAACKIVPNLWYFFNCVSLGIHFVIIIDQTSCQVLNSRRLSWKHINRLVACLILLAIIRCIPRVFDFEAVVVDVDEDKGTRRRCEQTMNKEFSWTVIIMTLLMEVMFICLCLVTLTYIKLKKFTRKRLLRRHDRNRTSGTSFLRSTTTSEHAAVVVNQSGLPAGVGDETQQLFVFVGAFLFSVITFPYSFYQFHQAFTSLSLGNDHYQQHQRIMDTSSTSSGQPFVDNVLVILSSYSSSVNFFVYVIHMKGFREDFVEWVASIMGCCCCSSGSLSASAALYSVDITTTTPTTSSVAMGRRSGVPGGEFAPQRSQRRPALDEENHFSLLHR